MTTDREDMEPVPEKEAQPSDIAKAAMLVRCHVPVLTYAVHIHAVLSVYCHASLVLSTQKYKHTLLAELQWLCSGCCQSGSQEAFQ